MGPKAPPTGETPGFASGPAPPLGPAPPPAPPLLAASASSFRVALGRVCGGCAAAREPGSRPRTQAFSHCLVAGEARCARLSRTLQGTALPLFLPPVGLCLLPSALGRGRGWANAQLRALGSLDAWQGPPLPAPPRPLPRAPASRLRGLLGPLRTADVLRAVSTRQSACRLWDVVRKCARLRVVYTRGDCGSPTPALCAAPAATRRPHTRLCLWFLCRLPWFPSDIRWFLPNQAYVSFLQDCYRVPSYNLVSMFRFRGASRVRWWPSAWPPCQHIFNGWFWISLISQWSLPQSFEMHSQIEIQYTNNYYRRWKWYKLVVR